MGRYTTLERVRNKLTTARGAKIFTEAKPVYIEAMDSSRDPITTIGIVSDRIVTNESFEGMIDYYIDFTSPTEFVVSRKDLGESNYNKVLIGSGTTAADFASLDGSVSIYSNAWLGTPAAGDTIVVKFHVHLSAERAEEVIEYAETIVDLTLAEYGVDPFMAEVPPALTLASTFLAAYMIWTDGMADQTGGEKCVALMTRWHKEAMDVLSKFLKGFLGNTNLPQITSFPSMITSIGTAQTPDGMMPISSHLENLLKPSKNQELFEELTNDREHY